MCFVFYGENFEALQVQLWHFCGRRYSDIRVFQKGVIFTYRMTSINWMHNSDD